MTGLPFQLGWTAALFAAVVAFGQPAPVQAQANCDSFYRIKRGDTLRGIAVEQLGNDRYRRIYSANRDILRSPERIVEGQLLYLPCAGATALNRETALAKAGISPTVRDNRGTAEARRLGEDISNDQVIVVNPNSAPEVVRTEVNSTSRSKVEVKARPLTLLTASGMTPLVDESLPDGGLLPVLVQNALRAGGSAVPGKLAFVDDRKSHLPVLMPTGAFDLAFPWPGANCASGSEGGVTAQMCRDFLFSRPLYQIDVAIWVRKDSSFVNAKSMASFSGRGICRPLGFPPADLESLAQRPIIVRAKSTVDCLKLLENGVVEGISVPITNGQSGPPEGIVTVPALTNQIAVHAIAWRESPAASQTIETLNAGLERLQRSGNWFKTVSGYLSRIKAEVDIGDSG